MIVAISDRQVQARQHKKKTKKKKQQCSFAPTFQKPTRPGRRSLSQEVPLALALADDLVDGLAALRGRLVVWLLLANGDDGAPLRRPDGRLPLRPVLLAADEEGEHHAGVDLAQVQPPQPHRVAALDVRVGRARQAWAHNVWVQVEEVLALHADKVVRARGAAAAGRMSAGAAEAGRDVARTRRCRSTASSAAWP